MKKHSEAFYSVDGGENLPLSVHSIFNFELLEKFSFSKLSAEQFDLATLSNLVSRVDRLAIRERKNGWLRNLEITMPTHNPSLWQTPNVLETLRETLRFLTGDNWDFTFVARDKEDPFLKNQPTLPFYPPTPPAIIPYSGGMDSWAAALYLLHKTPTNPPLLLQLKDSGGKNFFKAPQGHGQPFFLRLPYSQKSQDGKKKEESYRSRSFKFFVSAGLAAQLSGSMRVVIPENGQGAFGPTLLRYGSEWPLRGNHPGFTKRLEKLFTIITDDTPIFDHVFLWMTKGEVLKKITDYGAHEHWKETHSCPRPTRKFPIPKGNMNCGVCSNCLLRRVAIHTAGLSDKDDLYVWQDLDSETLDLALLPGASKASSKNDKSYAWLAIQDHVLLANPEILNSAAFKIETYEIAQALNISIHEADQKLNHLLLKHAEEWQSFLDARAQRSWVRQWAEIFHETKQVKNHRARTG